MVPLNISTFDFSPSKKKIRLLVPPKIFVHEINPYFLVDSCLTFIFFNEIYYKWVENYDNIFNKKTEFFLW